MKHLKIRFEAALLGLLVAGSMGLGLSAMAEHQAADQQSQQQGYKQCKHGGKKHGHEGFMKELNLSEDQKNQMKALHDSFRQENAAAIESMKAKKQQLKQLGDDPANQEQKAQLMASMKEDFKALMEKKKAQMHKVLTPEQIAKWEAGKAERKAKWEARKKSSPDGKRGGCNQHGHKEGKQESAN